MRFTAFIPAAVALITLGLAGPAQAQFNQYYMPVEKAELQTHVELQYHYSKHHFSVYDHEDALNVSVLSAEAQVAWSNRLELGVNIPFVQHAWWTVSARANNEVELGDMMLNFKARLFGVGDTIAVAVFANTLLPTASAAEERDYAMVVPGIALSAKLLGAEVGCNLRGVWAINGDDQEYDGDWVFLGLDIYGSYSLLGLLNLNLALQFARSLALPWDDTWSPVTLVPGVSVDILDRLYAGVAARIALNDDSKAYNLGRAGLLLHGGVAF